MNFFFATDDDLDLLAEWNHQLNRNEGDRNPMTIRQLWKRMQGWISSEYMAVLFCQHSDPLSYALYRTDADEIYLRQLFVKRGQRRQGTGREAVNILRTPDLPP